MMTTRPIKQTPIHTIASQQGVTFVEDAGWLVPDTWDDVAAAVSAAQRGVGLMDRSHRCKLLVEGAQSALVLLRALGIELPAVNAGITFTVGVLYRLRRDRFYLSLESDGVATVADNVEAAVQPEDGVVTATDVSHGRAELWLVGPGAAGLLSQLCGLDFYPSAFPNLTAKESSVAKTHQIILRHDVGRIPAYALIGARSVGAYVWQTILEAAQYERETPFGLLGKQAWAKLAGHDDR